MPEAATPIEIFRTGTHTAMSGRTLTFGDADLAAIAASYDPALHEAPIVVGHPREDAPAYGWVSGLAVANGRLQAVPSQVDSAFADLVRDGRFKKISASFYAPDAENNPKPGSWYLRHVGFLGAQPPAVSLGPDPLAWLAAHYAQNGEVLPRAAMAPTLSAAMIAADGEDELTISGLPDPCSVSIRGALSTGPVEVTDGVLILTCDTAGTLHVVIEAGVPFLPWSVEIEVT